MAIGTLVFITLINSYKIKKAPIEIGALVSDFLNIL